MPCAAAARQQASPDPCCQSRYLPSKMDVTRHSACWYGTTCDDCIARVHTIPQTAAADEDDARDKLNSLLYSNEMTGSDLRELLLCKWGRSYDVSIQKRGRRTYLHVFWKHLEQQSFPLSESEYIERLDAVAFYLTQWGVVC